MVQQHINSPTQHNPKRQYHYFYGSTNGDVNASSNGTVVESSRPPSSPAITENDSLVGESLVSTDNEEELPKSTNREFQQLLVSHSSGTGLQSLEEHPGDPDNDFWLASCLRCYKRFRRTHSESHILFAITGFSLFLMIMLALVLFPGLRSDLSFPSETSIANPATSIQQRAKDFRMEFPQVDRSAYGDPVSNFLDTTLFHSSLLHRKKGENDKREFKFPFPTGAFWTNLVLPPTADQGLSYPVAVYPYAYKWGDSKLVASYPAQHRQETPKAIHDYFFPDLTFGISEEVQERKITAFDPLSITVRYYTSQGYFESYLVQGSPYITVKYNNASPVIKAFTTFTNVLCPDEQGDGGRELKFGVCYSNNNTTQQGSSRTTTLHGVQFIIETQEGARWIMFSSELINLAFDTSTKTTIVASSGDSADFSGVLRFAIVPPTRNKQHGNGSFTTQTSSASDQIESSKGLQRLIYHANIYPISGDVSWSFRSSDSDMTDLTTSAVNALLGGDDSTTSQSKGPTKKSRTGRIGTISFKYDTSTFAPASASSGAGSQKSLLMLGLPHHAQRLSPSIQLGLDTFDLIYQSVKGPLRPVIGSVWSYDEPLPTLGLDGDSGSNQGKHYLNPKIRRILLENLKADITIAIPTPTENIYGFGKQAARLAQLAHIAFLLQAGNTTTVSSTKTKRNMNNDESHNYDADLSTVLQKAKVSLREALKTFLRSRVSDSLVYDANLGGLVTTDGLLDSNADFGNGRYNDHLFHNGYLLYACSIMGKLDSNFLKDFGKAVDAIFYDVANDSNFDSEKALGVFFPGARHKIWFDGHSFASGMFHFGNGKSQESSSEAVNCYYGSYLWSLVRNGKVETPHLDVSPLTDFTRLLLATEIRGARTYWHMLPPSNSNQSSPSVYSPEFSSNYMVGNLGMLDALCSTWFGTQTLYVHMINLLPVTSATGELFGKDYIRQEFKNVLKPLVEVDTAWKGFVIADQAIVEPNLAWAQAEKLDSPTMDSGLSKTQLLYWISTRSGFKAESVSVSSQSSQQPVAISSHNSNMTAACSASTHCATTGLTGDCCPTANGIYLSCCD